jgi:hypothetical protein
MEMEHPMPDEVAWPYCEKRRRRRMQMSGTTGARSNR